MYEDKRNKQIDGRLYSILIPPPLIALPLCNRTAVLLGALAGLFADAATLGSPDTPKEARLELALDKLSRALQKLNPIEAHTLLIDTAYAARLTCDTVFLGNEVEFNKHFNSKELRKDLYPVLVWCLWECVSDFFPDLGPFTQKFATVAGAFQFQKDGQ